MTLIRTSPSGPNIEVDAPVDLGPNSIYGNPTAAPAPGVDISLGLNTVLGRVAGNIVAAQLVTAQIALNQVTNAVLAQAPALTVKANPTGALADLQDVPAASDDTVFRRVGGVLDFGPLTPGMLPPAIIPLSSIEPIAANTVVANATAGAASPTAVPMGTNTVLGRVAGNIVAAQIVGSQIGTAEVQNANLGLMDAQTVKVNATGVAASPTDLVIGMNAVLGRVGGNIIAAQVVTAQIALNQVDNTILAKMAANTVKVNATALLADPQDLAVGANTVVGRVAGNIVAAQLVTAQIALNQVTNAVLAQMAALTVKANATNALSDPQDLAAGSNDTLLRRTGDTLNFGALTPGMIPSAIIPLSAIEQLAANTVVANATAGLASPTAVPVGLASVLGRVAGNIVAAQVVTAQIALNQVTNAILAQMAANTVKVNATAALADPQDLAVGTNTVLGRVAGNIVAAQLVDAQITDATISLPKLATQAANTVLANATAGVASPTAVAVGTNAVLGRVAGNIVAAQVVTAQIAVNQVTNAVLAQMTANTLKGNATAATADPQDISVGTNTVVGRVAGNIVAAQLVTAQIAVNQVTNAVLAQMTANTLKGNATAATADPQDISVGTNTVVGRVAGNIVAAQLVTAQIGTNQVTNATLAQMAALTVKANSTNATANAADLAAGSDDTVLRRTASTLSFGQLTAGMFPAAIIPLSSLATQAANTVVANATAGTASPTAVAIGTNSVLGRVAGNIVAAQLVTAQIAVNQVTNAVLAQMAANTLKGNATAATADPQDISVGTNTVVGRVAGNIVAAQLVTAQIAVNQVTNAVLAQMAANTLKGNATAATADPQDISVGTNTVLGRVAGNIVAAQLVTAQIAVNQVTNAVLAQMAANTVKANATAATADPQDVAVGTNTVLGRVAGNIVAAQLVTAQIAVNQVTNAVLAQMAANTVKANATAALADPQDISVGTNTVLGRVAGNIVAAQAVNAQITGGALSTVKGVATGGVAGTLQDLTGTQIVEFLRWGTTQDAVLAATTNDLALNATTTVLRLSSTTGPQTLTGITGGVQGRLLLVLDTGASPNPITLASNTGSSAANQFRTPGGVDYLIGFRGAVIIEWDNSNNDWRLFDRLTPVGGLASIAANTVIANATAATAQPTAVSIGTNTVLGRVAGNIVAAQLVTAQIAVNQVTNAVLAQMAANTVKANATAATADPQDVSVGTNTVLGRVAGNIVAAQAVNAQITGGALGTVKGVALGGVAGTLQDLTGAQLAENLRFNSFVTDTTSSGAQASYPVAATTVGILVNTPGAVEIQGITIPAAAGQRIVFYREIASTGVWTFRNNSASAGILQERLTLDLAQDVILGVNETLELQYISNRWRQISTAMTVQAANTIFANATAATDAPAALSIGTNTVLGRVAGNIVAAQLVTAQVANNQITNALLAQMAALTVKANATNATANAADLAAGSDDTVLRRTASTLNFGQLTAGMFPAAIVPLSSLATQAANTVVANATAGTASPTAVAIGTNTVLGRVAGNIVAAQVVNAQITGGALSTVKGVASGGVAGTLQDLTGTQIVEFLRWGTTQDLVLTTDTNNDVALNATTTVLRVSTNDLLDTTHFITGLTGGSAGRLLLVLNVDSTLDQGINFTDEGAGSTAANRFQAPGSTDYATINEDGFIIEYDGTLSRWRFLDRIIPFTGIQTLNNVCVLGKQTSGGSTTIDQISIGVNQVVKADGSGNITPGTIVTANVAADQITNALLADMTANTIKANVTSGTANPTDFSVGTNTVVGRVAGNIVAAQLVDAQITNATISLPKLAAIAANTVVSNATSGSAVPTELAMATNTVLARDAGNISSFAIGTNTVLGRVAGNITAAQLVDAQITTATISLPKLATQAANTIVANATAGSASPTAVSVGTSTVVGRVAGNIVAAALVPDQLATEASSIAVTFSIRVAMTATGAAADDVVIYNANAPFAFRILKTFPVVTALVAASTFVGRNATAGGGATVTSTFSGAAVSDDPAITANNGVSTTIAASGTLVIRRSSGNITGEVVLLCCKS